MSPIPDTGSGAEAGIAVVRQFFADLRAVFDGAEINPYRSFADAVDFNVTGRTPLSGTWHGMESVLRDFLPVAAPLMGRAPGHGVFPLEFISEGNKVAVLARGRGSNTRGLPYNNTYFFWFEVENGRITRFIEDFDSSLAWRVIFRCHLEEGGE